MQNRQLTPLDRILVSANNALRTVASRAGATPRQSPAASIDEGELDEQQKAHAAGLMRVNHAGEVAAQGL